jgi:hypothetical protein
MGDTIITAQASLKVTLYDTFDYRGCICLPYKPVLVASWCVPQIGCYGCTVNVAFAGSVAVGAAYYLQTPGYGQTPALPEDYSSWGVQPIFYTANGTALPAPTVSTAVQTVSSFWLIQLQGLQIGPPDFFPTHQEWYCCDVGVGCNC